MLVVGGEKLEIKRLFVKARKNCPNDRRQVDILITKSWIKICLIGVQLKWKKANEQIVNLGLRK